MKMSKWMTGLFAAVALMATSAWAGTLEDAVLDLQHQWAIANYKTPDNQKEATFKALVDKASVLSAQYPDRAEPKVWEAIIRAGYAGAMGGVSSMFNAMPQMKQGRDLLLAAEKIDPNALHGSVYTTLGSFYYMVPGGFIGFGDDDRALEYLNKALVIAPDDMDANYFMGDYWLEQHKYKKAIPYLQKVITLPPVVERPIYSNGRKAEARAKLEMIAKKTGHKIDIPEPAVAAAPAQHKPAAAERAASAAVTSAPAAKPAAVEEPALPRVAEAVVDQAAAPAATAAPQQLVVSVNVGNIRSRPNTSGRIVAKLRRGAAVARLAEQGDWYQVKLADGTVAWAHNSIFK